MINRKITGIIALVLSCSLLFTACGDKTAQSGSTSASSSETSVSASAEVKEETTVSETSVSAVTVF